ERSGESARPPGARPGSEPTRRRGSRAAAQARRTSSRARPAAAACTACGRRTGRAAAQERRCPRSSRSLLEDPLDAPVQIRADEYRATVEAEVARAALERTPLGPVADEPDPCAFDRRDRLERRLECLLAGQPAREDERPGLHLAVQLGHLGRRVRYDDDARRV